MTNVQKLIPEIKKWQEINGNQFDAEDWIAIEGNIKLAIGYSFIFWPDLIEYENCVFLKSHFSIETYNQWKKVDYVEYFSQIEYVLNHIHILDLFAEEEGKQREVSKDQIIYLGNVLREIYETKLRAQFKDKAFVVTFNGNDQINDLYDYELSFHQLQNESKRMSDGS